MMNLLFVHWNVDPVLFHVGGLQIRWYGLLFASVFVIGWYLFKWFFTREKADTRLMDPLFVSVLVATIVGARLGAGHILRSGDIHAVERRACESRWRNSAAACSMVVLCQVWKEGRP